MVGAQIVHTECDSIAQVNLSIVINLDLVQLSLSIADHDRISQINRGECRLYYGAVTMVVHSTDVLVPCIGTNRSWDGTVFLRRKGVEYEPARSA
jgi:hypothetical protein